MVKYKALLVALPLILQGCSMQGASALAFFSNLDKTGRWKVHPKTDFEQRMLNGDVECISGELFVADTNSGSMALYRTMEKCWDKGGVEIRNEMRDSSGKVLFSRISRVEDGYLVERNVEYGKKAYKLQMEKKDDDGSLVREYRLVNKEGSLVLEDYRVNFHLGVKGHMDRGGIFFPFKQEMAFTYDQNDSLTLIALQASPRAYHVEFTYDPVVHKPMETSVTFDGKLYSYKLEKYNSAGKVVELYYSDDITMDNEHVKYTYNEKGNTLTVESSGIKRQELYVDGLLQREEYYDYGGKIRLVARIELDAAGNVVQSTYELPDPKKNKGMPLKIYKYSLKYN